jgi:hypothetical protein
MPGQSSPDHGRCYSTVIPRCPNLTVSIRKGTVRLSCARSLIHDSDPAAGVGEGKPVGKTSITGSNGSTSRASLHGWLANMLSRPWWVGLGVVLATAVALMVYFLGPGGGSPSNSVNGNCNAQGNGNKVTCTNTGSGVGP